MTDMRPPRFLVGMLLGAAAGALGWGIRGQYGHEDGAMIAGTLVGFTLVLLDGAEGTSRHATRATALGTVGVSFGGSSAGSRWPRFLWGGRRWRRGGWRGGAPAANGGRISPASVYSSRPGCISD